MIESLHAEHDAPLNTNPASPFWRAARPIYAEVDTGGHLFAEYRTEIRTRWTNNSIYFLFVCPYQGLYLRPEPDTVHETNELWNWNVAEVFIGSDFKNIERYKEFEVSPQNEWVDLDIDLKKPHHEDGWLWNSGFEHSARIDPGKHIWYAAMRIPFTAVATRPPARGSAFRVNLFRTEGCADRRERTFARSSAGRGETWIRSRPGPPGDEQWSSPALPIEVTDPVGAGDSFDAGFLREYLRGSDVKACLAAGNLAGALSVTRAGGTEAFRDAQHRERFLQEHRVFHARSV